MLNKDTALYSILNFKCPRCHEGNLFRTPLLQGKIYDMYERCPHCNQRYELEPGFFFGAMYVGYALSAGALLITALLCLTVFGLSLGQTYAILLVTALIGFAFNARLSRVLWIHINISYDKRYRLDP